MNSTSKSKAVKATKPTRKQRKQARQNLRATVGGAPVAVSNDLRQFTRFSTGRSGVGLKMHTCCAIAEVLRSLNSTTPAGLLFGSPTPTLATAVQLNLTSPYSRYGSVSSAAVNFVSPVWDLIGSAFTRYRVNKLVFHYEPQSATTNGERLVFAFARDPDHPLLWTASPSSASNLSVSDSVAFMPWRGWSMDVTKELDDTLYYTYDFNASVTSSTDRFSNFGVISCVTSGTSSGTDNAIAGVLYMETEIELLEFCPISVTRPSLSALAGRLPSRSERNEDSKPVKPDDKEAMLKKLADTYHLVTSL